ncbi:MAG TPA: RNA polymerase sigma factor, partial [Kofleriaceae bacterium]|nr:RNA polymerase sigma factor [Kofleriaceae bacterium]
MDDVRHQRYVEGLTRLHGDYLRSLARRLCRSQLDPEDLVQDVFEKTLRSPIPDGANERAWLARVMNNLFIDKLRRRAARREDPFEHDPATIVPPAGEWWESLTADDIRAHLPALPADQRTTFELFAFDGKSYDEIAKQLG